MSLFAKKPIEAIRAEADAHGDGTLRRVLGPGSLVVHMRGCGSRSGWRSAS